MSKRFRDTDVWKMAWYRKLGSQGRDLWSYIHDNCDASGFFHLDQERLSFELGFEITLDLIKRVLNGKVVVISEDRLFLPAFISFQYGKLSDDCKPHKPIMATLRRRGIDPHNIEDFKGYQYPLDTQEDKTRQEQDKTRQEEGAQELKTPPPPPRKPPPSKAEIEICKQTWLESLHALGVSRKELAPTEQTEIYRAIEKHGFEFAKTALIGARYEPKTKNFNPGNYAALSRIFGLDDHGKPKIDKFLNLAATGKQKEVTYSTDESQRGFEESLRKAKEMREQGLAS